MELAKKSVSTTKPQFALDPVRHGPIAIKGFARIAELWGLSESEQLTLLGGLSRTTFYRWRSHPESARPSRDTLERISYILGIYKALTILLPDPAIAAGWIKSPNTARPFAGKRALDVMLGGNFIDLYIVRTYLDAQRGG